MKKLCLRITPPLLCLLLCLSFFVFTSYADDELLAYPSVFYLYSGGSYQQLLDLNPANDDVSYTPIYMPSITRFQIRGLQEFRGKTIHYSFLIAPMKYNSPTDNATFTRTLGNLQFSSITGFGNFNASLTAVSLPLNPNHLDMVYYQYASILNIDIKQGNDMSTVNGQANLSSVLYPYICTSGTWEGGCALLGASVYTSDNRILTDTLYFLQNDLGPDVYEIKALLSQRLPFANGYTFSEVGRDADGNLAVSETRGTWWDATLQTLKNLTFDLDRSVQYQNQIDAGSTNETGDALGSMLEQLNDNNAYGLFSSFPVTEISGDTDPGQLASILSSQLPVWWTQQVKDAIDAVAAQRGNPEEWVLPYDEAKQHLDEVLGLSGGD